MFDIYVTRKIPEKGLQLLGNLGNIRVWEGELPPPREVLLKEVKTADGLLCLLTDKIDKEVLDAGQNLKVISNYAVGFDNVDIYEATRRGIPVTNTPGVLTETTADLAFSLLLCAARNISSGDRYVRAGLWKTWEPMLLLGRDIHEATMGIVGMGRIGQSMARRAHGFNMRILYTNVFPVKEVEEKYGAEHVSMDALLKEADFISIHVPLTSETEKLIGARELAMMKKEAILINSARGPIIDEKALIDALKNGVIAGAGLDVFEVEPISEDHPLCQLDNVVILPHIGSASFKTRTKMAEMAAKGIVDVLHGKKPENLVNTEVFNT